MILHMCMHILNCESILLPVNLCHAQRTQDEAVGDLCVWVLRVSVGVELCGQMCMHIFMHPNSIFGLYVFSLCLSRQ